MLDVPRKPDIFVHLARGFDARAWERRWLRGELVGFNERFPYGYHLAREMGCTVTFSQDSTENIFGKGLRLACRALLGFDFVHAWRNRREILSASTVWTHTESQHLSIALLLKLMRPRTRPRVIGQSVWLIDCWSRFSWIRRKLYRWLADEIDVLTFHSPLNTKRARAIFTDKRCELVPFGICCDHVIPPTPPIVRDRIRVLAVGNDRHRDWDCLLSALANQPGIEVHIVSQTLAPRRLADAGNCHLHTFRKNDDLLALYRSADVVVVPLRENWHASGISALQEAALAGRPAICTRTGGLDSYFGDDEVAFVEPGQPDQLRARVLAVCSDRGAHAMAAKAQRRMANDDLSSWSYVSRHIEITRDLAGEAAGTSRYQKMTAE